MNTRVLSRHPDVGRLALIAGYVLLCAVYYYWTASDGLGDLGGDSAVYLLTAQYYSPWGSASPAAVYFGSQSMYPPLYPLVLGLGGGGHSAFVAHAITTTALLAALLCLYRWVRASGWSAMLGAAVVLLFCVLPGTYMQALMIHSENLYLALCLAAVLAVTLSELRGEQRWVWVAAAAVSAAALTRSAGLSALLAFAAYLVLQRGRRAIPVILAAGLLPLLWMLFVNGARYFSALQEKVVADKGVDISARLIAQGQMIWAGVADNIGYSNVSVVMAATLLVLGLAGAVLRARERRFDGFYQLTYLLMLFLWPFPAEAKRLLYLAMPLLIVHAVMVLGIVARLAQPRLRAHAGWLLIVGLLIISLPTFVLNAQRFAISLPPELEEMRRTEEWYLHADPRRAFESIVFARVLIDSFRGVATVATPQDCVYSFKPSVVGYYSGRRAVIPPREYTSDEEFHAHLSRYGCRIFHAANASSPSYPTPFYPLNRLENRWKPLGVLAIPGRPDEVLAILAEHVPEPPR